MTRSSFLIDDRVDKKHKSLAIIPIADRCPNMPQIIKVEYPNYYYTLNKIRKYIEENKITNKSITVDNGLEFKTLGITVKRLGVKIYKCDPYCSFQSGTNKRENAIARWFILKGKSMSNICFKIASMTRQIFEVKKTSQHYFFFLNRF